MLNLFDIVRLYDTRQGSGKIGKIGTYTIKEAQLIGRGADIAHLLLMMRNINLKESMMEIFLIKIVY